MHTHEVPSYLAKDNLGPWEIYLEQIDRVTPYLGKLAYWVETLKRPKRILRATAFNTTPREVLARAGFAITRMSRCLR